MGDISPPGSPQVNPALPQHRNSLDVTMRIIRLILGKLILFFDWLFTPRGIKRDRIDKLIF